MAASDTANRSTRFLRWCCAARRIPSARARSQKEQDAVTAVSKPMAVRVGLMLRGPVTGSSGDHAAADPTEARSTSPCAEDSTSAQARRQRQELSRSAEERESQSDVENQQRRCASEGRAMARAKSSAANSGTASRFLCRRTRRASRQLPRGDRGRGASPPNWFGASPRGYRDRLCQITSDFCKATALLARPMPERL